MSTTTFNTAWFDGPIDWDLVSDRRPYYLGIFTPDPSGPVEDGKTITLYIGDAVYTGEIESNVVYFDDVSIQYADWGGFGNQWGIMISDTSAEPDSHVKITLEDQEPSELDSDIVGEGAADYMTLNE